MKWKLRKMDVVVFKALTCVLTRSMLIYIRILLVAADLCKRDEIDRIEAQYRRFNNFDQE